MTIAHQDTGHTCAEHGMRPVASIPTGRLCLQSPRKASHERASECLHHAVQKVVGAKPKDILCCATVMLQLHTAAFNQEDAEHPVWAIKDKYREDRWQAVGLQVPLGTCQPGWSLPVSDE